MAYTTDWNTLIITIPKADTTLIDAGPPEIRELDIDDLWAGLHLVQESVDGMTFLDIFIRRAQRTLAGVVYAPELEIINGYTLEFEDAQYTVNIVGGNSNVSDVKVQNQVSVNTANSAGFTIVTQSTPVALPNTGIR